MLESDTPLESENSTCATLRGHLSNSWALVYSLFRGAFFATSVSHTTMIMTSGLRTEKHICDDFQKLLHVCRVFRPGSARTDAFASHLTCERPFLRAAATSWRLSYPHTRSFVDATQSTCCQRIALRYEPLGRTIGAWASTAIGVTFKSNSRSLVTTWSSQPQSPPHARHSRFTMRPFYARRPRYALHSVFLFVRLSVPHVEPVTQ